jgi:hypothetical protein
MAKARRFRALKLNEISAVDRPAQAHATFAIAKRVEPDVRQRLHDLARAVVKVATESTAPQTFEEAYRRTRLSQVTGELWPY